MGNPELRGAQGKEMKREIQYSTLDTDKFILFKLFYFGHSDLRRIYGVSR